MTTRSQAADEVRPYSRPPSLETCNPGAGGWLHATACARTACIVVEVQWRHATTKCSAPRLGTPTLTHR